MTPEVMYQKHKDLGEINLNIQHKILVEKFGVSNVDLGKNFNDMGLGDLDFIEYIMELEKRLGIYIPDEYIDYICNENISPIDFSKYSRDYKLSQLDIK
jgi:acyl carrier protein